MTWGALTYNAVWSTDCIKNTKNIIFVKFYVSLLCRCSPHTYVPTLPEDYFHEFMALKGWPTFVGSRSSMKVEGNVGDPQDTGKI